MKRSAGTEPAVRLSPDALWINGKPEILLCASLFYFRVPRGHWRERMEQLKAFGYNAIDVYFPWNYHEPEEGVWDFAGEKDAAAFLKEAAEAGLWVVARPGPYICSEWDGGALPAWLFVKEGVKLREAEAGFLRYASAWYDRILPILRDAEPDRGGTLLCVQLDNELDFYPCSDPEAYISALRDKARAHGLTVPLIACAGQGGVAEAAGPAEGVVPACNFYPNDRDPGFEGKVLHYRELLSGHGHPLLVTETNRTHYLLRRLLSCGAKLLGPYLQVSGTDFGFTNATNNWGRPLAFMTSDYDFGGMISPEGHVREEAYEGRLLRRLIETYGEALGRAAPAAASEVAQEERAAVQELHLHGGGRLVFATNLTTESQVELPASLVGGTTEAEEAVIFLPKGRSLALPAGIPLNRWGIGGGELAFSTLELFHVRAEGNRTALFFHAEALGVLAFRFGGNAHLDGTEGAAAAAEGDLTVFRFQSAEGGRAAVQLEGGRLLELFVLHRRDALLLEEQDGDTGYTIGETLRYPSEPAEAGAEWRLVLRDEPEQPLPAAVEKASGLSQARFLEVYGIHRGYAWYSGDIRLPEDRECLGYLIRQGSDVVSLYADGDYVGTLVPGGASRYVPTANRKAPAQIAVRTEIWGHSNFDDIRLPALRLNACKGLKGVAAVTRITDLTQHWRLQLEQGARLEPEAAAQEHQDPYAPVIGLGGWMSPGQPAREIYRRSFRCAPDADTHMLHFEGLQASAHLYVNGIDAGRVDPFDPFVDVTPFVIAGQVAELAVYLEKRLDQPAGSLKLYEGTAAVNYRVAAAEEAELAASAAESTQAAAIGDSAQANGGATAGASGAVRTGLPVRLDPGAVAWLHGTLADSNGGKGWRMRVKGSALKLTVLLNGRVVGRLWTPGSPSRPVFSGGDPESVYLPGPWFTAEGAGLSLLLEAVEPEEASVLQELTLFPV